MLPTFRLAGGLFLFAWTAAATAASLPSDLASLDAVPLQMVRAPLAKQIEVAQAKHRPYQFAVQAPLRAGLADGIWDTTRTGDLRWRLRVASPGAQSLNFEFGRFRLPPGAALWIYDLDGNLVQGPYTAANHTPEGRLWTAVVLAEQAVLELQVPPALQDQVQLELAAANHGFRGFGKADPLGGLGESGSCNIDVACSQGNNWRDEIRAVARYTASGVLFCSGQLVNNVRQNDDPLFLTANHCGIGQDSTPSSVVLYWRFQNTACNGVDDADAGLTQSGAALLARDSRSDFTLLRLNQAPAAQFDVRFLGWNASDSAIPQSGSVIHHPSGDAKKIAIVSTPATDIETDFEGDPNYQGWEVFYSDGTTEQGSSGSALLDQNKRVVGVLSFGAASCDNPNTSENEEELPDYHGRFNVAFDAKAPANQQLKAWLDPDNTGAVTLDARDASTRVTTPAGTIRLQAANGEIETAQSVAKPAGLDAAAPGTTFFAAIQTVADVPTGQTTTVTYDLADVTVAKAVSASSVEAYFCQSGTCTKLPSTVFSATPGNSTAVDVKLADGGPFDTDGAANGTVTSVISFVKKNATGGGGGGGDGGGGGGTLSSSLLALLAAAWFRRRHLARSA